MPWESHWQQVGAEKRSRPARLAPLQAFNVGAETLHLASIGYAGSLAEFYATTGLT